MKHIDESRLDTDLQFRFEYLADFMGFGADDVATIHGAAPLLEPLVPVLVDAIYDKLRGYDSTWRHFVPRGAGYEGALAASVESLAIDDPQIEFRKHHLGRYVRRLVTAPYDGKMVVFLDAVGKMHTPKAGSAHLDVPLVQMNALRGYLHDLLNATIMSLELPGDAKTSAIRAFSKLLWIQNDLISRHYLPA